MHRTLKDIKEGLDYIHRVYGVDYIFPKDHKGKDPEIFLSFENKKPRRVKIHDSSHMGELYGSSAQNLINNLSKNISDITGVNEKIIKKFLKSSHPKKLIRSQIRALENALTVSTILAISLGIIFVLISQNNALTGAFLGMSINDLSLIPLGLIIISLIIGLTIFILKKQFIRKILNRKN